MKLIFLSICLLFGGLASGWDIGKGSPKNKQNNCSSLGIYNGNKTLINKYPFMASIMIDGELFGAGLILNKHWILTIGYNIHSYNVTQLALRVGSSYFGKGGQSLKVTKKIVHENYKEGSWDYNIGLIKVDKPMKFGKKVNTVNIGTQDLKGGTKVATAGWGAKDNGHAPSEILLDGTFTVFDWKTCQKTYPNLSERMMCTFDQGGGPRDDDFGIPILLNRNTVYGMYVGGRACNPGEFPSLFTNVARYAPWIHTNTLEVNEEQEKQ